MLLEKKSVPTLSSSHLRWWQRVYGATYQPATAAAHDETARLYEAIRDNRRDAVAACVQRHPHVIFAKGDKKRTALYVASFFGRHEIVKILLDRGADKNLRCEGYRPVDVAGTGRDHAIDRMKVQFLLGDEARPRVIICSDDPASLRTSRATLAPRSSVRLQIHFSEPVADFISDDIVASPLCRLRSFAILRSDLYIVDIAITTLSAPQTEPSPLSDNGNIFVEVPAGVARPARFFSAACPSEQLNARSNRFVLIPMEALSDSATS